MKESWLGALAKEGVELSRIRKFRRFPLELLDKLELNDSTLIHKLALAALKMSGNTAKAESSKSRLLLTRFLPVDPLYRESQSPIDLYLLTHTKDVDILPTSLVAAQLSIKKNLQNVYVVGPQEIRATIMEIIERLNLKASYISDEDLLNDFLGKSWETMPRVPRMEMLKILCGLHSRTGKCLVVDGDTVLLRQRTWASQSRTILIVAQEYLLRHLNFNEMILGQKQTSGLGFVAHHQVLDTEELLILVQESDGISALASRFDESYKKYNTDNNVFPSEWQLIGDLRIKSNARNVAFAKFSNYGVSRDAIKWRFATTDTYVEVVKKISELRISCPGLYSLSLHRYK